MLGSNPKLRLPFLLLLLLCITARGHVETPVTEADQVPSGWGPSETPCRCHLLDWAHLPIQEVGS